MSGGSQHNPNGRQSQLGSGWSPLQLQVANFLARAPQVHMASDRGVTWHTPTPPPHLYHVPAPSSPDPLQSLTPILQALLSLESDDLGAMKNASSNSVYRHTATPPELYRHSPTPPDKHMHRHTPSPGDVKGGAPLPQAELYPHLGPGRDKLRPEELLAYARVGVDLSMSRAANGSPAHPASPALSVRDAPTINSLIARAQPRHHLDVTSQRHLDVTSQRHLARVDALLERLGPSPASPHSVIVHPRAQPTPSPPSSNEDSADSCGAPPGSKRKRKPERTIRVPTAPPPPLAAPDPPPAAHGTPPPPLARHTPPPPLARHTPPPPLARHTPPPPLARHTPPPPLARHTPPPARNTPPLARATPPPARATPPPARVTPIAQEPQQETAIRPPPVPAPQPAPCPEPTQLSQPEHKPPSPPKPVENGETPYLKVNGPEKPPTPPPQQPDRPARRKTRSGSAETIDDIAAMIASTDRPPGEEIPIVVPPQAPPATPVTVDNLKSVLASPEPKIEEAKLSPKQEEKCETSSTTVEAAAAPRRRNARTSNSESANVPVESPSEAKPAEPETSEAPTAEPTAASFVEVENQLEKMFAGIEEELPSTDADPKEEKATAKAKKRRKSAPTKGDKVARRSCRASTDESGFRRKAARKKEAGKTKKKDAAKDAYDSGSNASSSRSRGPYIQIRGPRDSPLSVSVINAPTGEEDGETPGGRRAASFRVGAGPGAGPGAGLRARGLHASTLGLRYDASTPDATWLCAFCARGPHAAGLGDLFGPYSVDTDCDEYRALDEATRRRYPHTEVWFHCRCALWAPGLVAAGARLWGLAPAVWALRGAGGVAAAAGGCCARGAGGLACAARACPARAHLPCAVERGWALDEEEFRAVCPMHK